MIKPHVYKCEHATLGRIWHVLNPTTRRVLAYCIGYPTRELLASCYEQINHT